LPFAFNSGPIREWTDI
jgi:hypothetical protein